jgi:hypothetical protein
MFLPFVFFLSLFFVWFHSELVKPCRAKQQRGYTKGESCLLSSRRFGGGGKVVNHVLPTHGRPLTSDNKINHKNDDKVQYVQLR